MTANSRESGVAASAARVRRGEPGILAHTEGDVERDIMTSAPRGLVVIADDDPDFLQMTATALQADGFETVTAVDGRAALATVYERLPDVLLLDMVMPHVDGFEVARRLGEDVRTRNIPIMAMTGHTIAPSRLAELGRIDDFLEKPFGLDELLTRLTLCLERSRRMRGVNPLTQLPGNAQIEEEVIRRLRSGAPFALLHIDLDEFKCFNDRYGFLRGDEAIRLLAQCCTEVVEGANGDGCFIGHIGGDDFAVVVHAREAEDGAGRIVHTWGELARKLYDEADASQGFIETVDRRGHLRRIPLMTVSIGVATTRHRPITSHWEASEIAAEMKSVAKSRPGSAIAVDRRRDVSQRRSNSRVVD